MHGGGAADANLAHLAGDQRGVRGDTATGGQDAFGRDHATEIFRGGFDADQQDLLTLFGSLDGAFGVEVDLAGGGTGAGRETGGDDLGLLHIGDVEDGGQQLFELIGRIAHHCGFPVDELLLDHVGRELQRRRCGALAVAGLEHEQLAFLDGELDVLHILEVLLQRLANGQQFGIRLGHHFLQLQDGFRGADTGDDVFALGVDQELAIELVDTVGRVAGEGHAGTGGLTGVAEHHRLHVDGRSPLGGDVVLAAVDDGAVVHPRAEHGTGGAAQLIPRVVGEHLAGALFDECLEALDELLLVLGGQRGVFDVGVVLLMLELMDDRLERFMVFALALLHPEHDVAVHLDEAAVAIPGEPAIFGGGFEGDHRLVVEAQVQDGVHHAGHGIPGAGANCQQQRHAGSGTELGAHDLLHVDHAGLHLRLEFLRIGLLVGVEVGAHLSGDGESRRHRKADAGHFGQVGTFAAQEGFHGAIAIGFFVTPGVNVFRSFRHNR